MEECRIQKIRSKTLKVLNKISRSIHIEMKALEVRNICSPVIYRGAELKMEDKFGVIFNENHDKFIFYNINPFCSR